MNKSLAKPFLIVLVVAVLIGCYFVFRPFLIEIIMAAVLVSILYKPFSWLAKVLYNRSIAAALMCILVLLIIILPITELIIYGASQASGAYESTVAFLNQHNDILQNSILAKVSLFGFDTSSIKNFVMDIVSRSSGFFVNSAATIIQGTTNFIFSLLIIVFSMFFFFVGGEAMLMKLMYWSPLPNKYDIRLFNKFRDVSYSTIISTFVVITAQGIVGGIGYFAIGMPAFIPGILIAVASLVPMIGSTIIYIPTGIYLLATGQVWQGVFILLWGFLIVGTIDNLIRMFMIKGKAHINPLFVFLAILGGVPLFGFWGIVIGPLIVSLAVTVFHIYELEFAKVLDENMEVGLPKEIEEDAQKMFEAEVEEEKKEAKREKKANF